RPGRSSCGVSSSFSLLAGLTSVGAGGRAVAGLFEGEDGHQGHDQRHAEQVEGIAEGEDVSLLLHDMADRDIGTMRGIRTVEDAVIDEILSELLQPRAGGLL